MTHNLYIRHNDVQNIGLVNASTAEGETSIQRIFGVCHSLIVKKIVYTNFGTCLSDSVRLTIKTSTFQKPEYG